MPTSQILLPVPDLREVRPSTFGLLLDFGFRISDFAAAVVLAALLSSTAAAQPASPTPVDPLMQLMLSQPPIDVESPVVPLVSLDPPVVRPGEFSTYRVIFNALEESVEWPAKLAFPPPLEARPGAHGQMLAPGGAKLEPHAAFNYHVRASQQGQFTIPEFTVTVYGKPVTVPAAQLEVVASPPASLPPAQRLILEVPTTNLFVGQAIKVRVLLPGTPSGFVPGLMSPAQITGEGLFVDQTAFHALPPVSDSNGVYNRYETSLTPLAVGNLSAFAQAFTAGFRNLGPGPITFRGPMSIPALGLLLDSDPVELRVRPLPREGELPGFTGAVGTLALDRPELDSNLVRVGEPVKLKVKVHGDSNCNLARVVPPPPPHVRDWQIFVSTADTLPPQIIQAQGFTTFIYTLIPLTEKTRATPAIPFSCFDPDHGSYIDVTIPAVPIQVKPGAAPADLKALSQAGAAEPESEKEPVLSGLATSPGLAARSLVPVQQEPWFPLVQLVPAGAIFGLWNWDRRRRFLELHPDLVLRRRARRALRRECHVLHRAARAGDASRFAAAAVNAMRLACSPHYPAEPRALVGNDVLGVLSETDRSTRAGELVRRFFALTDAARFGTTPPDTSGLLDLKPDLDRLLRQLDEQLL
ncbi:MAG TPA: BatD family protein [Candidatus Binatia bacterium]|jgi:hypothetical protein|nr:BatD family protein [Candidatus Binatia bacterium]